MTKHTLETCIVASASFKTKTAFRKGAPLEYASARYNGWLETLYPTVAKQAQCWTLKRCIEDALKYKTRSEWKYNSGLAYQAAVKKKWLEQCCSHMKRLREAKGAWTLERCKNDALKYGSRMEWNRQSKKGYSAAHRKGWIDECCKHMLAFCPPEGKWNFKACKEDALKYQTRKEWMQNSPTAYTVSGEKKWRQECCKHMLYLQLPNGTWNFDACKTDALKYKSRIEWARKSVSAYSIAHKNNWLEDCCGHMERLSSDYNCFYLWRAKNTFYNGLPVYKIGVTSLRLGTARIEQVALEAKLTAEILVCVPVDDALKVEKEVALLGMAPKFDRFSGHTEFRAFTADEIAQILWIISKHSGVPLL